MAGLEETLALDVADALASISEVEDRMTKAASAAESAFSDAFSSALGEAQAFADLAGEALGAALTAGADAGGDSLSEALAQFDEVGVEVTVDSAEVDSVAADVAEISGTTDVTVTVDSTQVDEVVGQVEELAAGVEVPVSVSGDMGGGADPTQAVGGVSTAAGVATGGIAGLNKAAGKLIPVWGQVAIAGAGFAAVTKTMFDYAVGSEAANKRLTQAYGDQTDALQDLTTVANLSPGVDTLKELTLATGSSGAGLKTFIANQAQLGIQSGATREQLLETGKGFALLANYVSAARPELGTADQVAAGLAGALARGGRFAAKFGLDVGATAEIAARASEQYSKPTAELSLWEKQTAGLSIALERLGPNLGTTLDDNLDSPIIKMRSLERELKGVLSAAGEPLVDPLIAAMIALQPAVTGVAEVFGKFGGAVVPVLATALVPLADALGAVADLFAAIPGPLIGAAAAFYGVSRGAGMLLPLIAKIGPALSAVSAKIGLFATSIKFDGIVAAFGGVQKEITLLSVANAKAAASSTALIAGLEAEGAATYGVTEAILAETAAMQASVALKAALVELGVATAEVAAANLAVKNGEAGAEARLTAALAAEAQAQAVVTAATTTASTARVEAAAATGIVITGLGAEAVALSELSVAAGASAVASETAAANVAKAGAAANASNPLILALTVALGLAAAAWFVFGGASKKADDAIKEGKTTLADYRDSLNLTNTDLAKLSSASAQQQFREASGAAQEFYDSLGSDLTDDFNRLKFNLAQVGGALSGNKEDARALREQLLKTGEVKIEALEPSPGVVDIPAQEAATAALKKFKETGELSTSTMEKYEATLSPIAIKYLEQAKAAAALQEALETEAEAEIKAGNARDVSAIAALAASGQLGTLGEEGEIAARALLTESGAAEAAAAKTTEFEVAAEGATGTTVKLLAAAQRASEALTTTGAVGVGDLGAARALAASDAFASLPDEVQKAVQGVVDFADAEVEAAQEAGELLTSLGEVAQSVVGLTENLGEAVDRFDALAASQATFNATNRDLASTVRDVDNQVGTLGTSLAGNAATFDSASINAKNYQDYLKLLTTEQQKAITDLEGTEEAKAAATAAAVKGSAEATEEATQIAKDNSDTLLDFFDGATEKIRTFGEEQLKAGKPVGEVNAAVGDQVSQLRDAALAAGISAEEFDAYLQTVGVGVTGFSTEQLDTSGVTKLTTDLESLNSVINLLPPEKQVAIRAETDPEAQRALIEESLQGLFGAVQVAIKTYLAAPTQEEKLFALATIQDDPSFAVTAVVNLGIDPAQAANAIATLNAYNNDPANAVKIVPTAETAAAIAGVNAVADQAKAEIPLNVLWDPAARAKAEAEIEKERQASLLVIANTEQLDPITNPVTKDVQLNIIVPDWAKGLFPGISQGTVLPTRNSGRSAGREANARRAGKGKEQGGALIDSYEYATGGARLDDDVRRKLGMAAKISGAPKPGRYGPGANITFAENGTAGEYFISRSITDRARNQGLVQAAAQDLGVNLAPQVTVNASAGAQRQQVPPELAAAINSLADAKATPPPPGQAPIAVGQINIQESRDAYQTADQISDALASEAFRRGSF